MTNGRKPAGNHPQNRLRPMEVKKKKKPGRYADGGGLYLVIDPSGAKRWVLRTVVQGRRRDMGLGGAFGSGAVSLADARSLADKYRRLARDGGDPFAVPSANTGNDHPVAPKANHELTFKPDQSMGADQG